MVSLSVQRGFYFERQMLEKKKKEMFLFSLGSLRDNTQHDAPGRQEVWTPGVCFLSVSYNIKQQLYK